MKLLIDIPDETYEYCKAHNDKKLLSSCILLNDCKNINEMTNGEVLETMFNIVEKEEAEVLGTVGVRFEGKKTGTTFSKKWYNAKYNGLNK